MFVGHLAVGLGAKRFAPRTSLGTLMLAAVFPDLLWCIFLIAGIEHARIKPGITAVNQLELYDYPISHSLLTDVLWAAVFAGVYFLLRRYPRGAWVLFCAVLSHWLLDFVSHISDMPLAPGVHEYFGLGLWNSRAATFLVEGLLWLVAILLYARGTRPAKPAGSYAFWTMIGLLTALWMLGLVGTPPPSLVAVEIVNLVLLSLLLGWAYWIDRLRPVRPT